MGTSWAPGPPPPCVRVWVRLDFRPRCRVLPVFPVGWPGVVVWWWFENWIVDASKDSILLRVLSLVSISNEL